MHIPHQVYVIEGKDGKIKCTVYGPNSVDVTWYKVDKNNVDQKIDQGAEYDITQVCPTLGVEALCISRFSDKRVQCKIFVSFATNPTLKKGKTIKLF